MTSFRDVISLGTKPGGFSGIVAPAGDERYLVNIVNRIGMAACRSRLRSYRFFLHFGACDFLISLIQKRIVLFSSSASRSGFGAVISCAVVHVVLCFAVLANRIVGAVS